MTFRLIQADCVEAMQAMDEASVDAIVTDPPYGLEFMGKEWDKFSEGRGAKYAKGGEVVAVDMPGTGFSALPIYAQRPAKRCSNCGKQSWSGSPCQCPEPRWIMDNSPLLSFQFWCTAWATEALRVLKPGGHLLAFGGTRTYHRLTCAIEDAGFEIRDCIAWLYGSGFPKSLDVSKAIDKAAGAEREVVGVRNDNGRRVPKHQNTHAEWEGLVDVPLTAPATDDARTWQGWGTALKPAFEPIVLARKPLSERNVAANVLRWGTGALNVDGCRIGTGHDKQAVRFRAEHVRTTLNAADDGSLRQDAAEVDTTLGRWPANVTLDPEAAAMLDEQTGETSEKPRTLNRNGARQMDGWGLAAPSTGVVHGDTGGASRGSSTAPRPTGRNGTEGLEHMARKARPVQIQQSEGRQLAGQAEAMPAANTHPTVKPVELMRWLCRMVTPKGGTVLDPFTGSGSTGVAALREGFEFVGIEREPEYVEIARARIIGDAPLFNVEVDPDAQPA